MLLHNQSYRNSIIIKKLNTQDLKIPTNYIKLIKIDIIIKIQH